MTSSRMRARRITTGAAVAGLVALTSFSYAPQASAHDVVISSNPEDGSVVEEFPDRIVLTFSGVPMDSFNTVALNDADTEAVLFTGEPELDGQDVSFNIPDSVERAPGSYTVGFQITSSDGHATRGGISFEVAGETEATNADTGVSEQPDQPADDAATVVEEEQDGPLSGALTWVVAIGAVLVLVAVVAMMIMKSRVREQYGNNAANGPGTDPGDNHPENKEN